MASLTVPAFMVPPPRTTTPVCVGPVLNNANQERLIEMGKVHCVRLNTILKILN